MNITGLRTVIKKTDGTDAITPGFPLHALAYSRFGYALLDMGGTKGKMGRGKHLRRVLGFNDGFFTTAFW